MVTVWKDGVHSDEFFGMRACDNGWECHHYYDGKDEDEVDDMSEKQERWKALMKAFNDFLELEPDVEYVMWNMQTEYEDGESELSS